ncbi:MAG: putative secreted protein [Dactylosporangium sp.]|jgi:hypothetical protein|nr:putative secreted protein [Dactylosporangium sp.]
MSSVQIVVIIVALISVALVTVGLWAVARRRSLRRRFGPEYDRLVSERDGRQAAERELRARERRHAELDLRPLSHASRAGYAAAWEDIQARFVDAPGETVDAADELLTRLIAERGYPGGDFDERAAHLSVEHARTLQHYRDAHDVTLGKARGEVGTEQLRQALVHYRALFADLLGDSPDDRRHERVDPTPTAR